MAHSSPLQPRIVMRFQLSKASSSRGVDLRRLHTVGFYGTEPHFGLSGCMPATGIAVLTRPWTFWTRLKRMSDPSDGPSEVDPGPWRGRTYTYVPSPVTYSPLSEMTTRGTTLSDGGEYVAACTRLRDDRVKCACSFSGRVVYETTSDSLGRSSMYVVDYLL